MSATPMLSTRNLVKRFGGVVATSDVSLEIAAGETHATNRPNGAGKTTLISQLQGELPPTSGTIHFKGQDITREPPHRRAQLVLRARFRLRPCCRSSPRWKMFAWRCRRGSDTRSGYGARRLAMRLSMGRQ